MEKKCLPGEKKWSIVRHMSLYIKVRYVSAGNDVKKNNLPRPRTKRGEERTKQHEQKHVDHFISAYYDMARALDSVFGTFAGEMDINGYYLHESKVDEAIAEAKHRLSRGDKGAHAPGGIWKIWEDMRAQELDHKGDDWAEWGRLHGGINDDRY